MTDACSSDAYQAEEGFIRIGRVDSAGRRSLWTKILQLPGETESAIVLRAGREGDDTEVQIDRADLPAEKFKRLLEAIARAIYCAEDEDPRVTRLQAHLIDETEDGVPRHRELTDDEIDGCAPDELRAAYRSLRAHHIAETTALIARRKEIR